MALWLLTTTNWKVLKHESMGMQTAPWKTNKLAENHTISFEEVNSCLLRESVHRWKHELASQPHETISNYISGASSRMEMVMGLCSCSEQTIVLQVRERSDSRMKERNLINS